MIFLPNTVLDSFFQTKVLDDENEATLLTALTEILDNVDDENLSPFDTLPDSDLLSGQKGRENSPVSVSAVQIALTVFSALNKPCFGCKNMAKYDSEGGGMWKQNMHILLRV